MNQQTPNPQQAPQPKPSDAVRNALIRQALKASDRRFDENASVTGFGQLELA